MQSDGAELIKRCKQWMRDGRKRCEAKYAKKDAHKMLRPAIPMNFTLEEIVEWMRGQQVKPGVWACAYCGRPLVLADVQLDHIEPLESGGSAELHNQTPCCEVCNREKGELDGIDFLELKKVLRRMKPATAAYILTALRQKGMAERMAWFPRKKKIRAG